MRQRFLEFILTTFLIIFCMSSGFAQEGGYLSELSIAQGEKLALYLSTSDTVYDLNIYRLGITKTKVLTLPSVRGGIQIARDSSYVKGCRWHKSAEITIPDGWTPGVYEADLPTSKGIKSLVFVVRPKDLGSYSKVLVCLTANTWQAYNNWGGKSLYNYNSTGNIGAVKVSFNRPFSDTTASLYYQWTDKLIRWLEKEKIPVEFCINSDLDRDQKFLNHYEVYATVGHDEYWSRPERSQFERFLSVGGKMIVLSGNTAWWQVRFEDSLKTLVCYREYIKDPFFPSQLSLVTTVWGRYPVYEPENIILGASFENGGYVNKDTTLPPSRGFGGYTVYNSRHWIYKNCELQDGDIIDSTDAIVGYETDGALFKWKQGVPSVTSEDKTPANFRILGISPAAGSNGTVRGHATMGYYAHPGGGAVFNGASINWVNGLAGSDTVVPLILRNVMEQFLSSKSLPPEIIAAEPVHVFQAPINHESVQFSRRTFNLDYTTIDTFIVHALDPLGKKLFYSWQIGDSILGKDTVLILPSSVKKLFSRGIALEVRVSNGSDTVSMDWTLVNSKLSIISNPPLTLAPLHSQYKYNSKAVSGQSARITYALLKAPSWLHITRKGIIYGKTDTLPGIYSAVLRAADKYGNTDSQKFTIHVIDTAHHASVMASADYASTLQCYPNPMGERLNIAVMLAEETRAEIEIFDVTGIHIRALLAKGELTAGPHLFEWNRTDDFGRRVPSGIYLCRLTVSTSFGKAVSIIEKLVVM